jgi:sterol desaturase/sphingolipid hydroxylase (fatty acid hydroxylase superfamily)
MRKEHFQGHVRLFKNPILEALTRTSPAITLMVYLPIISFFLYINFSFYPGWMKTTFLFVAGFFSWTLIEYMMHRFVFHFMSGSPLVKRIHYYIHGVHHQYPKSKDKLFMPPVPALMIVLILYGMFLFLLGKNVYAFLPGLLTGYLAYVFIHYAIHTIRPPHLFKKLWAHHYLHHYKHDGSCFGVSTTLWDRVFHTMPDHKSNHIK